MSEDQTTNAVNTMEYCQIHRGKMDADEFRHKILALFFYKIFVERWNLYANDILKEDKIKYSGYTRRNSKRSGIS